MFFFFFLTILQTKIYRYMQPGKSSPRWNEAIPKHVFLCVFGGGIKNRGTDYKKQTGHPVETALASVASLETGQEMLHFRTCGWLFFTSFECLDIERLCRQRAQQPSRWLAVHSLWHQSKGIRSDCVGLACRCCFTFIILFVCSWELWLSLGKNGLWSFIFILKIYPLVI